MSNSVEYNCKISREYVVVFNKLCIADGLVRGVPRDTLSPYHVFAGKGSLLFICRPEEWYGEVYYQGKGVPYFITGDSRNGPGGIEDVQSKHLDREYSAKFRHVRAFGDDGVDHINIYSKGKTELGRMLSNFYHAPFEMPELGVFNTIEGLWYYQLKPVEDFKVLNGFECKSLGKRLKLSNDRLNGEDLTKFKYNIRKAMWIKANTYENIRIALMSCKLPLEHYYNYGGKKAYAGYEWILDSWDKIRLSLVKEEAKLPKEIGLHY